MSALNSEGGVQRVPIRQRIKTEDLFSDVSLEELNEKLPLSDPTRDTASSFHEFVTDYVSMPLNQVIDSFFNDLDLEEKFKQLEISKINSQKEMKVGSSTVKLEVASINTPYLRSRRDKLQATLDELEKKETELLDYLNKQSQVVKDQNRIMMDNINSLE